LLNVASPIPLKSTHLSDEDTKIGELCIFGGGRGAKVSVIKCVHLGVRSNELKIPLPPPVLEFSANISRSMGSRRKIVGVENVLHEIFYEIGYSQVSLSLPISLKIHSNKYKLRFLLFFTVFGDFLQISRDL